MIICSRVLTHWDVKNLFNDATARVDDEMSCDLTWDLMARLSRCGSSVHLTSARRNWEQHRETCKCAQVHNMRINCVGTVLWKHQVRSDGHWQTIGQGTSLWDVMPTVSDLQEAWQIFLQCAGPRWSSCFADIVIITVTKVRPWTWLGDGRSEAHIIDTPRGLTRPRRSAKSLHCLCLLRIMGWRSPHGPPEAASRGRQCGPQVDGWEPRWMSRRTARSGNSVGQAGICWQDCVTQLEDGRPTSGNFPRRVRSDRMVGNIAFFLPNSFWENVVLDDKHINTLDESTWFT